MTKKELIQRICRDCKLTPAQANRTLNSIAKNVARTLSKKGRVQLSGLGSFSVARKLSRSGRNPQTGHRIRLRRRASVKFTPARSLQRKVR